MTQYNEVNIKILDSQVNKLKISDKIEKKNDSRIFIIDDCLRGN